MSRTRGSNTGPSASAHSVAQMLAGSGPMPTSTRPMSGASKAVGASSRTRRSLNVSSSISAFSRASSDIESVPRWEGPLRAMLAPTAPGRLMGLVRCAYHERRPKRSAPARATRGSVRQRFPGRVDDAFNAGEIVLLAREQRDGHVVAGDPLDRRVEARDGLVGERGRDLRAHAQSQGRLVHDDAASRLPHAPLDLLAVKRSERHEIDDLRALAVRMETFGRLDGAGQHRPVTHERDVLTFAHDLRPTERARLLLVWHVLLVAVERRGLEEEDGILAADARLQQARGHARPARHDDAQTGCVRA